MRRLLWTLALAGCSYPDFHFTKSDAADETAATDTSIELDSAAVDSATADDTTIADDSAVAEDTTVADTARPDSAKPDTAVVDTMPEATPPTGCVALADDFCVDWDKASTATSPFTYFGVGPTGKLSLDVGGGRSSPNAMVAETAPSTTDRVVVANTTKVFSVATNDALIKVDFYVKLEAASFPTTTDGAAFLLKIQRETGEGDGMTFSIDKTGYFVDRIGLTYEAYTIASPKPKIGVWTHVRVHTRLVTAGGSITVWIDDMSTAAFSKSGLSTVRVDSTGKQLIVGLYSQDASAPFKVRYDDVSLNY